MFYHLRAKKSSKVNAMSHPFPKPQMPRKAKSEVQRCLILLRTLK